MEKDWGTSEERMETVLVRSEGEISSKFGIPELTSMAAEDFFVDYGGDWQTIKAVCERFP